MALADVGAAIGNGLSNLGAYSAQAASRANQISQYAQSAQGQFNQNSVDIANAITDRRIQEQYAFNAAQAAAANDFTREMWGMSADYNREMYEDSKAYNQAMYEDSKSYNESMWERNANWNESMYNRQMEFNSSEAEKNRQFQKQMQETAYQRAMTDMEKAGLNPILAYGGINNGSSSGSMATVGGTSLGAASIGASSISPAQVSSAQGQAAQGGLTNASSASESNYTGQMEYLSGTLGLISAVLGSATSALKGMGTLGDLGESLGNAIGKAFEGINKGSIFDQLDLNKAFKIESGSLADYLFGNKTQQHGGSSGKFRGGSSGSFKDYSTR